MPAETTDCWVDIAEVVEVGNGHEAQDHLLDLRREEVPNCEGKASRCQHEHSHKINRSCIREGHDSC